MDIFFLYALYCLICKTKQTVNKKKWTKIFILTFFSSSYFVCWLIFMTEWNEKCRLNKMMNFICFNFTLLNIQYLKGKSKLLQFFIVVCLSNFTYYKMLLIQFIKTIIIFAFKSFQSNMITLNFNEFLVFFFEAFGWQKSWNNVKNSGYFVITTMIMIIEVIEIFETKYLSI